MQFQVPQFIDVEDKIFGPLTFKQFVYIIGGVGVSFFLYTFLPFFFAVILIIPVAGFVFALAFYKINNKPFINIVEYSLRYFLSNKLYVWRKENKAVKTKKIEKRKTTGAYIPKLSDSKLKDLSWSLDVHKKIQ